jgi:hypothetical protein
MAQAIAMVLKHWEVFSFDGSFGQTDLLEHQVITTPDRPINCRYRPVTPALEGKLKDHLDKWLKLGVIKPAQSPWNFALVAAPKKNGDIRWCVDFRALNGVTIKDSHQIGNVDDNLARLSRSTVFSTIDGAGAFNQINLAEQDRFKTAFSTPVGQFQFRRLPFGLCNSPATYARLVNLVLHGIPYHMALPYLDDTITHSRDLASHFPALDLVLGAHAKAGLKLQPSKCHLFRTEIDYLGHRITSEGIAPVPEYVQLVKDWPLPTTKAECSGRTGY